MQDFIQYGYHIMQNVKRILINHMKKYKKSELDAALLAVEHGTSHKEVANGGLNKSIIAREMRKRKNEKGRIAKQKKCR